MSRHGIRTISAQVSETPPLSELVYELLDAHDDTARLVAGLGSEPDWDNHLRYLRDLQRRGREILAARTSGSGA